MPTSDLDMPLLPSAEQIRRREFATVRRGYDPQQVRAYLTSIANQVETLERELSQLRLEAGSAAARSGEAAASVPAPTAPAEDPYDALSKRFATLIEMADHEAEKIVGAANADAATTLEAARSEADRIRVDAQAHAERARQEGAEQLERARIESDRAISGLAARRRALVTQLEDMRRRLIAVADELSLPLEEEESADGPTGSVHGAATTSTMAPAGEAPASEAPLAVAPVGTSPAHDAPAHDASAHDAPAHDAPAHDAPAYDAPAATPDTPVDPRYEDLWVSTERSLEIPDLAPIDLDFEDREE